MAVLREIVAQFRLGFDKKAFVKADRALDGLSSRVRSALPSWQAMAVGITAASFAVFKLVEAASAAEEATNVMNAAFVENRDQVEDWAVTFADATGRSRFAMREMAANLGAMLNPLMDKNAEAAANMSTGLTELSVDLASFFNTSDDKALVALRAGIVGETEPMRKFGVVMLDATLQAFALSEGITKSFKSMSIAEKTALRYNFILDQTKLAQGDATRTADSWENASKGAAGALTDLATTIGGQLLPFAESLVIGVRDLARGFEEWTKNSKIIEATLVVLGLIAVAVAVAIGIAWGPVILPFVLVALAIAAAILVLDDFLVFMSGGDSVIGRFIESMFGPGSAAAAADGLRTAWDNLKAAGELVFLGLGELISDTIDGIMFAWNELVTGVQELGDLFGWLADTAVQRFPLIGEAFEALVFFMKPLANLLSGMLDGIGEKIDQVVDGFLKITKLKDTVFDFDEAVRRGGVLGATATIGGVVQDPSVSRTGRGGGGNSTTNTTNNVNVDARGATRKVANQMGRVIPGALNRQTGAATTQVAG